MGTQCSREADILKPRGRESRSLAALPANSADTQVWERPSAPTAWAEMPFGSRRLWRDPGRLARLSPDPPPRPG